MSLVRRFTGACRVTRTCGLAGELAASRVGGGDHRCCSQTTRQSVAGGPLARTVAPLEFTVASSQVAGDVKRMGDYGERIEEGKPRRERPTTVMLSVSRREKQTSA